MANFLKCAVFFLFRLYLQTLVKKTFVWILSTETLEWKVDKLDAWGFPGAFQNQVNHCCYNEVAFENTDLNSLFEWLIFVVHSLIKTYFTFFQNWKVLTWGFATRIYLNFMLFSYNFKFFSYEFIKCFLSIVYKTWLEKSLRFKMYIFVGNRP